MKLRVDLLPYGNYLDTVLVVDVLRATTTAGVYLENGAQALHFAQTPEEALTLRSNGDIVLAGERGGRPISDFDLGNSPLEASQLRFDHKTVVMNTTNGTRAAFIASETGKNIFLASLRNAHSATRRAKSVAVEEIAIVCAGVDGRAGVDDIYTAGVLCEYLLTMGEFTIDDGARIALTVRRGANDPLEFLSNSAAGQALERIGLGLDLAYCSQISETPLVPTLVDKTAELLHFTEG